MNLSAPNCGRPKVEQDWSLTKDTIGNILLAHVLTVPYLYFVVWPFFQWRGVELAGPTPTLAIAALQIFGSMVCEDTLFYWTHRLLHHRYVYKYIHKQHHRYRYTVSYAAEYSHFVEQTLSNVIPTYAGPVLFRMHISVISFWSVWRAYAR